VANLPVREPQAGDAGSNVGLVLLAVATLLCGGPVIAEPVRCDHQAQVGPMESTR